MVIVYDTFKHEFVDELEMDIIAPPERYVVIDQSNELVRIIDSVLKEYKEKYPDIGFSVEKKYEEVVYGSDIFVFRIIDKRGKFLMRYYTASEAFLLQCVVAEELLRMKLDEILEELKEELNK